MWHITRFTYHEENKATAGFDVEAMRMLGKQGFSFLGLVVQQQGDAGPGDLPVLHRVFRYRHYPRKTSEGYSDDKSLFFRDCRLRGRQMENIFLPCGIVSREFTSRSLIRANILIIVTLLPSQKISSMVGKICLRHGGIFYTFTLRA